MAQASGLEVKEMITIKLPKVVFIFQLAFGILEEPYCVNSK